MAKKSLNDLLSRFDAQTGQKVKIKKLFNGAGTLNWLGKQRRL